MVALLNNGVPVRNGVISDINLEPEQPPKSQSHMEKYQTRGNGTLNVNYVLKESDGLLNAGHCIAKEQFILSSQKSVCFESTLTQDTDATAPEIIDNHDFL